MADNHALLHQSSHSPTKHAFAVLLLIFGGAFFYLELLSQEEHGKLACCPLDRPLAPPFPFSRLGWRGGLLTPPSHGKTMNDVYYADY